MIHANFGVLLPLQTAADALSLRSLEPDSAVAASIDGVRRDWGHVGVLPPEAAAASRSYRDAFNGGVAAWAADLAAAKTWTGAEPPV